MRIGAAVSFHLATILSVDPAAAGSPAVVSAYTLNTMTSLRIYLARHGQDGDNARGILNGHRDEPLTDIGIQQAQTVAGEIRDHGLKFDAVHSSPLQRARRTAEIISEAAAASVAAAGDASEGSATCLGGDGGVQIMDDLIERNFGIMTGVPTAEIKERCGQDILQTDTITYFLSPPGAETFPDLIRRAHGVINRVSKEHPTGSILLVTHGDFGKMLYAAYYELDWQDVLKKFHFGNSEVLLLSEGSSAEDAHVFQIEQYNH